MKKMDSTVFILLVVFCWLVGLFCLFCFGGFFGFVLFCWGFFEITACFSASRYLCIFIKDTPYTFTCLLKWSEHCGNASKYFVENRKRSGKEWAASTLKQGPLTCNWTCSVFGPVNIVYTKFKIQRKRYVNIPMWPVKCRVHTSKSVAKVDLNPSLSCSSFATTTLPLRASALHICDWRRLYLKRKGGKKRKKKKVTNSAHCW